MPKRMIYSTSQTVFGTRSSTDWDGGLTGAATLPEQLWPYIPGRISSGTAPASGIWQVGQIVWAISDANASLELSDTRTMGWYCVQGGKPGVWQSFSTDGSY